MIDEAQEFCAELKISQQNCLVTGRSLPVARQVPVVPGLLDRGYNHRKGDCVRHAFKANPHGLTNAELRGVQAARLGV